jgi:ATP-dependent Lhr-like helicase
VDVGHRELDLAVEVPGSSLGPITTNECGTEIYNRLVNWWVASFHAGVCQYPAAGGEIARKPGRTVSEDNVAAHHGNLSRKLRLSAERS